MFYNVENVTNSHSNQRKRDTAQSNVICEIDANASVRRVATYSPAARQEKVWVGQEEEPLVPPGGTGQTLVSAPSLPPTRLKVLGILGYQGPSEQRVRLSL